MQYMRVQQYTIHMVYLCFSNKQNIILFLDVTCEYTAFFVVLC